jgi:hypothetical protein
MSNNSEFKNIVKRYKNDLILAIVWNGSFLFNDCGYAKSCIDLYNKVQLYHDIINNIVKVFTDEEHIKLYGENKDLILNKIVEASVICNNNMDIANENLYYRTENEKDTIIIKKNKKLNEVTNISNKILSEVFKCIFIYGSNKDFDYIFKKNIFCVDI